MADQSTVSGSTIVPSDSASQVKPSGTAPSKGAGRQKRPSKASKDKNAPPGAVKVPPGGQNATGKSSPVVSATIPLSDWGEIDLAPHRNDIEPSFTIDAQPFDDLVSYSWNHIQSRYSQGGKFLPFGLFRYYCMTMWWYRVLFLMRRNGVLLNAEQKALLNLLDTGEEFALPGHVGQYLANAGNFSQGGENFLLRTLPHTLGAKDDGPVFNGWFTDNNHHQTTANTFWLYAQLPSPGVYTTYAANEAGSVSQAPNRLGLDDIAPVFDNLTVVPTDNIVGWSNVPVLATHQSWRSTYANLGWSATGLPSDTQTQFNISTSTLKWVSDRLGTIKDFKTHSSKQLTLSVMGNPIQAYYLRHEHNSFARDIRGPAAITIANGYSTTVACRQYELSLASRYAMDAKLLAPSFSFGYRLERSMIYRQATAPVYYTQSAYAPWFFFTAAGSYANNVPVAINASMNAPLNFGSGPYITVPRFGTHSLLRSAALDAALVFSDTK